MAQPVPPDVPVEAVQDPKLMAILQGQTGGTNKKYFPPNDPPVWTFSNPFVDIWNPNKTVGKTYGYEQVPFSQAEAAFFQLDRKGELQRFQELAFQAGLYGPAAERGDIRWGAYDDETFQIWSDLNKSAAISAKAGKQHTVWDRLQDLVDNRPENLGKEKKAKRQPLVTILPDPRELEETVRGLAPSVIGREADDAWIQDFTAMYTKYVQQFQENKYALEGSEEGGTLTAPPNAEDLAKFRLRTENPEAFAEKQSVARQQAYLQLLKGAL